MEHLAVAILEILQVADVLVLAQQLVEILARLAVLELIVGKLTQRLGELFRQVSKLLLLVLHPGLALLAAGLQRLALAVQDVLEPLLHLRHRALQIEVAVALADLLAQLLQKFVQTHHAGAVDIESLAGQPVHGLAHVVGVGEVLGEFFQHLVGVQPDALRAVPLRVAYDSHCLTSAVAVTPEARTIRTGVSTATAASAGRSMVFEVRRVTSPWPSPRIRRGDQKGHAPL